MIATVALVLALRLHQSSSGVRTNRIAFYNAMLQVKQGWSRETVRAILGPPDDVWGRGDSYLYVEPGHEIWAYGSRLHLSFPVLGRVEFSDDGRVVADPAAREEAAQPESAISDSELFPILRAVDAARSRSKSGQDFDPLFFVRATNALQPLGTAKAVAALLEYSRLGGGTSGPCQRDVLFWLLHFLFVPKYPADGFRLPAIGRFFPDPGWGIFPTLQFSDVPLVTPYSTVLGGLPERFAWYVRDEWKNWAIRPLPMRPPDDPFQAFKSTIGFGPWIAVRDQHNGAYDESTREGFVLKQILCLVQNGFAVPSIGPNAMPIGSDYDQVHEAFLAAHCHWDAERQMYVRSDGSFTPDWKPPTSISYEFPNVPRLSARIYMERDEAGNVEFESWSKESPGGSLPVAIITFFDVTDNREIRHAAINDPFIDASLETLRKRPPHEPDSTRQLNLGFPLPPGHSIQVELEFNGQTYRSPVFVP